MRCLPQKEGPQPHEKLLILPTALLISLAGCAADVGTVHNGVRSCLDTGNGIVCLAGDDVGATDVDGDGNDDEFVCSDADSASDSDDSTESDGNESGDVVSEEDVARFTTPIASNIDPLVCELP